jgi:hypothetical protein
VGLVVVARNITANYIAWTIYYTFQRIHAEFMVKSRGGTDSAGIKWKPLSRRTVAYRPINQGDAKKFGFRNYQSTRSLLTPTEDKRWSAIFAYQIRRGRTKQDAAKIAWSVLRKSGAKTKLMLLGDRPVSLLVLTHRLEMSLRPGTVASGRYIPRAEQFVSISNNQITLGTTVPYADKLTETRPILPGDLTPWIRDAQVLAKRKVGMR